MKRRNLNVKITNLSSKYRLLVRWFVIKRGKLLHQRQEIVEPRKFYIFDRACSVIVSCKEAKIPIKVENLGFMASVELFFTEKKWLKKGQVWKGRCRIIAISRRSDTVNRRKKGES